jgi:hypothetical protein
MTTEQFVVVLFFTSNHAFRAEKVLMDCDISCKLVPVPRHLSSECGVCIRIALTTQEAAVQILKTAYVEIDRVQKIDM